MGNGMQGEQFVPHGMCYLWDPRMLALQVISDALIALAYFSIPLILVVFVMKRRDLPFPAVFTMFGLFIVACGMTHVMDIWTIWHPTYWLSGSIKAVTAGVSLATAVLLVGVIPKALAIKGRADLYEQVEELNATLEQQVLLRTSNLRESERFLHAVTDNIPSWVAYWDADLRCRYANAASLNWFGKAPASLLGLTVSEVLGPDIYAFVRSRIQAAMSGEPQKFERQHVRPDGSISFALAHYIPDRDGDAVRGFYVILSDITDFKDAEAQLAGANEHLRARTAEAETATLFKSQFLANMSHEIRSPMNAILGMLQLLQSTGLAARQADYAAKAYTATQALLRLLSDILDFSKIEAGKLTFENTPFEIDGVVRDLSSLLPAMLGNKPIELIFVIDEHLPKRLQGDVFRLRQVLLNLAGNAIKFTDRGEIIIEIKQVALRPNGCEVAFSVTDTGIGIAPEQRESIFEGFNQGSASTPRRGGGTGLGLTISRHIVSLMGGHLDVESELGRGSRFHFTVTLDSAEDWAGGDAPVGLERLSHDRQRVLIVDDNGPARTALQNIVRSFGWSSDGAASGVEALELVRRCGDGSPYDTIFVDWLMPDLDGWQTACRLRALVPAKTSIVLMASAHALAECSARTQWNPNVVDAVLLKPVSASAIADSVNELLASCDREPVRPATTNRLGGLRILVVDDFSINLQIANELLSLEGALVTVAESGRDAIEKVMRSPNSFDVVLMDVQMPDMDGYVTTRRLRELPQMTAKIIAMTANAMEPDEAACLSAGMDGYISKPIDVEVVVRTILSHTSQIRTVDVESALKRMGNNGALFATIAGRFIETTRSLFGELRAFLQSGAFSDAANVLHLIKGSAATVGNEPLSAMASQFEMELKQTGRLIDPVNDLARLEALLATGNAALEAFLAEHRAAPPAPERAGPPDRPANREEMRNLSALLGDGNLSALEVYEDLAVALKAALPAERHAVLVAAMNEFDFAAAVTILDAAERDL